MAFPYKSNLRKIKMSNDWVKDIETMHIEKGFYPHMHEKVVKKNLVSDFALYRLNFIQEELNEGFESLENQEYGEFVDALIDICVVAITTLDLLDIDSNKAWNKVYEANMSKSLGMKEGRANPLNLPDMKKPENFVSPNHDDNIGFFNKDLFTRIE